MMKKADFQSIDRMVGFIREDLRHCIGVDANWVVALALSAYTEAFGHMLPNMEKAACYRCYNEFLVKWMHYRGLIDPKNPKFLYDVIRNGLAHEYLLKVDAEVNMGTGPCGVEIMTKGKKRFVRFNIITYYDDFIQAIEQYRKRIRTDPKLQDSFDARMKGRQRLK
jgi:hypothetical protein